MHQREHCGGRTVSSQRGETLAIVFHVFGNVSCCNVEDIYQHTDMLKDGRLLGREVRVHEGILAATVPQVQDEISEEADMVLFNVYRGAKT